MLSCACYCYYLVHVILFIVAVPVHATVCSLVFFVIGVLAVFWFVLCCWCSCSCGYPCGSNVSISDNVFVC